MERRLAAIVAADVVGYSRLMGDDEEETLVRLKAHQDEVINPNIARHKGRIVKLMGDGMLVEFTSVVDAVRCAVDIQKGMREQNGDLAQDRWIRLRIGINLGDVIIEGEDIYGDGVNIAARLEGLADVGGICVSRTVLEHVKGKVKVDFESLGAQSLKNISEPVQAFKVLFDLPDAQQAVVGKNQEKRIVRWPILTWSVVFFVFITGTLYWSAAWERRPEPTSTNATTFPQHDGPSIAVLPFTNMSNEPAQEYFADGITGDLVTDLAKFPDFQVIAHTSTAAYKDDELDIREISRELGAKYILEGSVEKGEDKIRVNAQLIEGATGNLLWAERYERPFADLFLLRDEIRAEIVGAITGYTGPLLEAEMRWATMQPETAVKAHDLYYQAYADFVKFNAEANQRARALLERSIELNPNDATVYALLAWTHFRDNWVGWSKDREASKRLALEAAKKAVKLEPSNYKAHWSLASAYRLADDPVAVKQAFMRAFALNPNDPDLLADWGEVLRDRGDLEESVAQLEQAMRLNPRYPVWYAGVLSTSYFMLERYEDTLRIESNLLEPSAYHRLLAAAAHGYMGNIEAAKAAISAMFAAEPDLTLSKALERIYWDDMHREHISTGLRKAEILE